MSTNTVYFCSYTVSHWQSFILLLLCQNSRPRPTQTFFGMDLLNAPCLWTCRSQRTASQRPNMTRTANDVYRLHITPPETCPAWGSSWSRRRLPLGSKDLLGSQATLAKREEQSQQAENAAYCSVLCYRYYIYWYILKIHIYNIYIYILNIFRTHVTIFETCF